jgi:Zn-dependent M28 family amino/carboxypeptidase
MKRFVTYVACALCFSLGPIALIGLLSQPFVQAIAFDPPSVDPERLRAHVKHLSVDVHPRRFDVPNNLDAAGEYVFQQLKASGAKVAMQEFMVEGAKYKNIVARYGPENSSLLVIGAHYDSFGGVDTGASQAGHLKETQTPGADDNASGVAGLIELGRLLGQEPQARGIELVAYALEEPPHFRSDFMGSVFHAKSLLEKKLSVDLMISLEMIGYFSNEPKSQSYPFPGMASLYSDRGDFIAIVGRMQDFGLMRRTKARMLGAAKLAVHSINAPAILPGIDFSDHRSYWNLGIPALMVTDTAFFRNKNYHTAEDTYDKLDYRRMAQVVQAVYALTRGF